MPSLIAYQEVARHNTPQDCWVVIKDKVYNLTSFAPDHPGGSAVVTEQAGKDATADFLHAHPESIIELTLGPKGLKECLVGEIDKSTLPKEQSKAKPDSAPSAPATFSSETIPPLRAILNLHDFEAVAQRALTEKGKKQSWDYYSSGADDERTIQENIHAFQRIWLKPRILVDVHEVEMETTMLGTPSSFPVYLTAVAMCGMGHEDGEVAWAKAAHQAGVPFMIPNLSSKSFPDIVDAGEPGQQFWYQMYVNPSRDIVLKQLKDLEEKGVKVLCITVDSAVPGKRERDLRNKIALELGQQKQQVASAAGTKARKSGTYANRDPALSWDDLTWFRQHTKLPIVLKGVQCGEDAVRAAEMGCAGIILSNHGGRNLDTSRSGIEILPEVMAALRSAGKQDKLEVYVDGGVRRGTDILKALALGAKGVGIGKPAVYAMSGYGAEGIARCVEILREEFTKAMQLVGCARLSDLRPEMLNIDDLSRHPVPPPHMPSPFAVPPLPAVDKLTKEQRSVLRRRLAEIDGDEVPSQSVTEAKQSTVGPVKASALFAKGVATGLVKTVLSPTPSAALHRSAVLLFVYLIIHLASNCLLFFGSDIFNHYINALRDQMWFEFFEWYLLLAAVVHGGVALYLTKTKLRYIMRDPLQNGKLLLSSIIIVLFVYGHLEDFRFATPSSYTSTDGSSFYPRDVYGLVKETFADMGKVLMYLVGTSAVFYHLNVGWPKTVMKMGLDKESQKAVSSFGASVATFLSIGFSVLPVYMWWVEQQTQAQP